MSAGALTGKLCAWASGGVYDYAGERIVLRPHTRKREALTELFRALKPPFFVLYWFNFSVEDVKEAAHAARLKFRLFESKDPRIVSAWNAGEIDVLAAHPQSAGMGLNLQAGEASRYGLRSHGALSCGFRRSPAWRVAGNARR